MKFIKKAIFEFFTLYDDFPYESYIYSDYHFSINITRSDTNYIITVNFYDVDYDIALFDVYDYNFNASNPPNTTLQATIETTQRTDRIKLTGNFEMSNSQVINRTKVITGKIVRITLQYDEREYEDSQPGLIGFKILFLNEKDIT